MRISFDRNKVVGKLFATSLLVLLASTCGQALAESGAAAAAQIPYSTMQVINEGDSDAIIVEKLGPGRDVAVETA